MKNKRGFVHIVVVIVITLVAALMVAAAWYFEENKEVTSTISNNVNDVNTAVSNVNSDVIANVNAIKNVVNTNSDGSVTNMAVNISNSLANTSQNSNSANSSVQSTSKNVNISSDVTTLVAVGDAHTFTDIETTVTLKGVDIVNKIADLEISYSKGLDEHWQGSDPGATGYYPNPSIYAKDIGSDLLSYATVLYRTHYTCDGKLFSEAQPVGAYEKINLASGYGNFICRNRQQEQCVTDGTFDHYYDERCDYGIVTFSEGAAKSAPNFKITVQKVSQDGVEILAQQK